MLKEQVQLSKDETTSEIENKKMTDEEYYNRRHYVVWSGGIDSTSILMDMIEKMRLYNKPRIHTIYVDHQQLFKKAEKEKQVRQDLMHHIDLLQLNSHDIEDRSKYVQIEDHIVTIRLDNLSHHQTIKSCSQPYFWLSSILPYVEENAVIHFGFLKNESVFEFIDEIEDFISSTNRILGRNVIVEFPYKDRDKIEVISDFMTKYPSLYEKVWFCEGVTMDGDNIEIPDKPCYNCNSCLTHTKALYEVTLKNNRLNFVSASYNSASHYPNIEEYVVNVQTELIKWIHDNIGFTVNDNGLIMLGRAIHTYLRKYYKLHIVTAIIKKSENIHDLERDDQYHRVRVYIVISDRNRIDLTDIMYRCERRITSFGYKFDNPYKFIKDIFIDNIMSPIKDTYEYEKVEAQTTLSIEPELNETMINYLNRVKESSQFIAAFE